MNTYLKQFLEADFTPWRPHRVYHGTDIKQSELPVVEISGFDLDKLNHIAQQVRAMTDEFLDIATRDLFRHWWTRDVRNQGWKEMSMIIMENGMELVHDSTQTTSLPRRQERQDQELKDILLDIFLSRELALKNLMIFKLEPNGWIQPHIDRMLDYPGLSYFWMPLHDFPPCLKIWPYGWLHHRVGNMYLFNHSKYVHAAVNQTDQDRFILGGRVEVSSLPDWFVEQFNTADQTHQKLWSTSSTCLT